MKIMLDFRNIGAIIKPNETRFCQQSPFKVEADGKHFSFLGRSWQNLGVQAFHRSKIGIYSYLRKLIAGCPWFESRRAHYKYHEVGVYLRKGIMRLLRGFFVPIAVISCLLTANSAYPSENPYVSKVVSAIYKAEGGSKTRHPYGILSVNTSDARKTCYEIVNWRYVMWSSTKSLQQKPFLVYLRDHYAPLKANNDPRNLNANWLLNVSRFMEAK